MSIFVQVKWSIPVPKVFFYQENKLYFNTFRIIKIKDFPDKTKRFFKSENVSNCAKKLAVINDL
jgi:hypothetical protein